MYKQDERNITLLSSITEGKILQRKVLIHLILDPSSLRRDIGSPDKGLPNILEKPTADLLESIGRTYCYQIYRRRLSLLSDESKDGSETETDSEYTLHDTSDEVSSESDSD